MFTLVSSLNILIVVFIPYVTGESTARSTNDTRT